MLEDVAGSLTTMNQGAALAEQQGDFDIKVDIIKLNCGLFDIKKSRRQENSLKQYFLYIIDGLLDRVWTVLSHAIQVGASHVLSSKDDASYGHSRTS